MLAPNEALDAIKRRALEITADIEAKLGPYQAEIVPGCSPLWHVLTIFSERDALEFLPARGFGVYSPCFETTSIVRGRKVTRQRPLFPGHLFLFVWDIKRHWRRIKACPGVASILTVEERPVVVPFDAIYRMQAIEFTGVAEQLPYRKRRKKKNRSDDDYGANDVMSISTKSYWAGIETLDDDGRVGLLHKALGLTSQQHHHSLSGFRTFGDAVSVVAGQVGSRPTLLHAKNLNLMTQFTDIFGNPGFDQDCVQTCKTPNDCLLNGCAAVAVREEMSTIAAAIDEIREQERAALIKRWK